MEHYATIKLSTKKFPMQFNETVRISLADAKKLNDSKSWDAVKAYLGDKFNENVINIQIDTPLVDGLTNIVILRPDKVAITSILGDHEFHLKKPFRSTSI